jgi:hypothetical protein
MIWQDNSDYVVVAKTKTVYQMATEYSLGVNGDHRKMTLSAE